MLKMSSKEASFYFLVAEARAYIFLVRSYFPSGFDVAAIWTDSAGSCFKYIEAGGGGALLPTQPEVDLIRNPRIIANGPFNSSSFAQIQADLCALGAMSLPHEIPSRGISHVCNLCMIRVPTGKENHFRVNGGFYSSDDIEKVLGLMTGNELGDFYWKMRNGNRERKPIQWT